MSGLRRSRPDEQDASLRRLREISATRQEADSTSTSKTHRSLTPYSIHSSQSFSSSDDEEDVHRIFLPVLKVPSQESNQFKSINNDGVIIAPLQQKSFLSVDPSTVNSGIKTKCHSLSPSTSMFLNESLIVSNVGRPCNVSSSASSCQESTGFTSAESKLSSRSNHTGECKKPLSSPSSPSSVLKHLKMSGFCSSKRRESEPILESHRPNRPKAGITDRHWEKLRSILVAMRDEPVHFDMTETGSVESCYEPDGINRLESQEKLLCLQREVADLRVILRQKESDLIQLEKERDAAIKLVCKLKASCNQKDTNMALEEYRDRFQNFSDDNVSKEEVIGVASQMFEELVSQRSYLEHFMSVVLSQAPHLLEPDERIHRTSGESFTEEDDFTSSMGNESDDEVWC